MPFSALSGGGLSTSMSDIVVSNMSCAACWTSLRGGNSFSDKCRAQHCTRLAYGFEERPPHGSVFADRLGEFPRWIIQYDEKVGSVISALLGNAVKEKNAAG